MRQRYLAAVLACYFVLAMAADLRADDLAARVRQLEAQVAALQIQLRQPSGKDVDAVVDAVIRDADRRSRLFSGDGQATAGCDADGFFIRSGAFEFRPSISAIFRSTTSLVHDAKHGGSDAWENGFEFRRIELEFEGTLFSPNFSYGVVWKSPASGGTMVLDEAFVIYNFPGTPWAIKAGQFNDDVYHEFSIGFKRQLAAEKSLMNEMLMEGAFDRVQGVAILYGDKSLPVRFNIAAHDGAGSANTSYRDSPADIAAKEYFGFSARAEWKPMGDWKAYKDFSARETKSDLLVIGLGADWTQGQFSDGITDAVGGDRIFAAADVQWELPAPKIGVFAALTADYTSFRASTVGSDRLNWGALIQAGWAINNRWEIFGRYDLIQLDGDFRLEGAENIFHEFTVGVNYFLGRDGSAGHRAKITVDFGYLPNGSPIRTTNLGIPSATESAIFYLRAQLQLVI